MTKLCQHGGKIYCRIKKSGHGPLCLRIIEWENLGILALIRDFSVSRWQVCWVIYFFVGSQSESKPHYNDVIMSTMASQITSPTIVYSTVYSRRRSKKTWKLRVTGLCVGNSPVTGEFPAQRASNAEDVSIWWRYHDISFQKSVISALCPLTEVTARTRRSPTWAGIMTLLPACAGPLHTAAAVATLIGFIPRLLVSLHARVCDWLAYWNLHKTIDIFRRDFRLHLILQLHWILFRQQYASFGSGNCLVPNKRQAITWTYNDEVCWYTKYPHASMI